MFNTVPDQNKTCPRCGYLMRKMRQFNIKTLSKTEPRWVCGDCYYTEEIVDGGGEDPPGKSEYSRLRR
ncbi:hypothetical protein [Haloferax gibbonsii]|uniref:hypothetical protein n=1 Tax=Haloferax gibbonsii TaxID=35746 RepID=UPI000AA32EE2|nr:hypothetical protein [Haloferax gibbonsii]